MLAGFFVAGKEQSRLRFSSKYTDPHIFEWFFARTELSALAGVDSLVLVGQKKYL